MPKKMPNDSHNSTYVDRHVYLRKDQVLILHKEAYKQGRTMQGQLRFIIDTYFDTSPPEPESYGLKDQDMITSSPKEQE